MSKFPHMPLFTDAFIADTTHLNATETGAYLLLLMTAWRSPGVRLPDDDKRLARWARVDPRAWARIKPVVMEFWTLDEGYWTQKRLVLEHDKVCIRADTARANGAAGGRPKSLKNNDLENPAGSSRVTQKKASIPIPIKTPLTPHGGQLPQAASAAAPQVSEEGLDPIDADLLMELEPAAPVAKPPVAKTRQPRLVPADWETSFETFWSTLPRHPNSRKGAAKKCYERALKRGATVEAIQAGAAFEQDKARRAKRDLQYMPHGSTWLNDDGWLCAGDAAPAASSGVAPREIDDAGWETALNLFKNTGKWPTALLGPAPGMAGCRAPQHILHNFGHKVAA